MDQRPPINHTSGKMANKKRTRPGYVFVQYWFTVLVKGEFYSTALFFVISALFLPNLDKTSFNNKMLNKVVVVGSMCDCFWMVLMNKIWGKMFKMMEN